MGEAVCGLQFALGPMDLPSILWGCGEDLIPSHVHIFSELPKKTVTFLAAIVNTLTHLSQQRGCPAAQKLSSSAFLLHFFLFTIMPSLCLSRHPWNTKQGLRDSLYIYTHIYICHLYICHLYICAIYICLIYPQASRAPCTFCHSSLLLW